MLPLDLDPRTAAPLVSTAERPDYLEGIDLQQLSRALIRPVRAVADRGGKSWRSYVALACCDAVGGDSQPYLSWLALPELMHVGSLLVDDVQDGSTVRRGGPAAHVLYGEGPSLNAGAACYFLPHLFMEQTRLPDSARLRIYELYLAACRAAHSGQALDLDGLQEGLRMALERGDGDLAERRVRAVHRLKSAAPAGALARVGAILGQGSEEQTQALGAFVEDVGLAFQIVDDVLNLRGFEGDRKARGEDLVAGKVTMPVAKAVGRLTLPGRRRLGEILATPQPEWETVQEAIDLIEGCGALEACQEEAERLIETGWRRLDPLLPPSQPKLMLRAFGWFVLQRHY
jgi:geranylgeranyl pyrophosphate synthase